MGGVQALFTGVSFNEQARKYPYREIKAHLMDREVVTKGLVYCYRRVGRIVSIVYSSHTLMRTSTSKAQYN